MMINNIDTCPNDILDVTIDNNFIDKIPIDKLQITYILDNFI